MTLCCECGYYSRAALIFSARAMCGYYSRAAIIRCAATIRINTVVAYSSLALRSAIIGGQIECMCEVSSVVPTSRLSVLMIIMRLMFAYKCLY